MKKLKNFIGLCLSTLFLLTALSCSENLDQAVIPQTSDAPASSAPKKNLAWTKQPDEICIHQNGAPTVISCKAEQEGETIRYFWFESDAEGQTKTPLSKSWSKSPELQIESFAEKGIRYFICAASSQEPNNDKEIPGDAIYSNLAAAAWTGLPTVSISTGDIPTSAITRESYVPAIFCLTYADGTKTTKILTKKGIKGRGNSSWGMPKKGYNLNFDDKESFFDLPAAKKWCLVANYIDRSLLRNKVACILGIEIFNYDWNPTLTYVDLVINGEYLGNYLFCEKNTLTAGRIEAQDISDCTQKKIKNSEYIDQNGDGAVDLFDGGFILEVDARHDADFWFDTERGVATTLKDPDNVTDEIWEHIKNLVQNAENVLYGDDFSDSENGWRKFIDEDSVIDWYLTHELMKSFDAVFGTSVYMHYNPKSSKIQMGPNWDFDVSSGTGIDGFNKPSDWYIKNSLWISRFFEDLNFIARLKTRWNQKKAELQAFLNTRIQSIADANNVSAELNFFKWPLLGEALPKEWGDVFETVGVESRLTYQSEVDYLVDWLNARFDWLDSALDAL